MVTLKNRLWQRLVCVWLSFAVMLGAVCLSPQRVRAIEPEADIYECLSAGFYGFEGSVDVSAYGLDPEGLADAFARVIKDDPYLFFVAPHLSYTRKTDGHVLTVRPTYTMTEDEALAATVFCRSEVERIAEKCAGLYSDVERALFLHDYICANYGYDDSRESADLYSFLLVGRGTCQGYTYAYTALLRQVGIPVTFAASDTISHIWNLVNLDGEWYHADLTWDDAREGVSHRHFLLSDAGATEQGKRDWYSANGFICPSERFADFDFGLIIHGVSGSGDVDHSGRIDPADLVGLRVTLSLAQSERMSFCFNCADINGDGLCDKEDIELLRWKIMSCD